MKITAADVSKLRKMTGAGMMDCKKALQETEGNFEEAIDILRKKGTKVAAKRADRDATEGLVLAKVSDDKKFAAMVVLNCETDFVAKNQDFEKFATDILALALANKPADLDALKAYELNGMSILDGVTNMTGIIGEKIDLSYYTSIEAEYIESYIHNGSRLASMVGFSKVIDTQAGKDISMQIAAMAPVAIDKGDVDQTIVDKEIQIGKEQAIEEGKPAELAERIAVGKLNKFFKDNTLLNQMFVKDNKKTIREYLKSVDKEAKVVAFKRFTLGD